MKQTILDAVADFPRQVVIQGVNCIPYEVTKGVDGKDYLYYFTENFEKMVMLLEEIDDE